MGNYTERNLVRDIKRLLKKSNPEFVCQYKEAIGAVELRLQHSSGKVFGTLTLSTLLGNVHKLKKRDRIAEIKTTLNEYLATDFCPADELLELMRFQVRKPLALNIRDKVIIQQCGQRPDFAAINRGDLAVELCINKANSMQIITLHELSIAEVTLDEAFRVACANLIRLTDAKQWTEIEPAIWLSTYRDNYDFARVVAAGNDARFPFNSRPLVFAPSNLICLVTNLTDADLLEKITEIGYELSSDHKPFSQLFWSMNADGNWNRWTPEVGSGARPIADHQYLHEKIFEYAKQRAYLLSVLGSDIYIDNLNLFGNDEKHFSACTYSFDLHSYLPVADFVALLDPAVSDGERVLGLVPWEVFKSCLGANLETVVDDLMLPYFKIMKKLTPAQKASLRSQTVDLTTL